MTDASWNTRIERRLAIALAASVLLHVILSASLTQGLSSRPFSAVPPTGGAVSVRVVPREVEPPSAADPPEDTPAHRNPTLHSKHRNADATVVPRSPSAPATSDAGLDAADPTYYTARQLDVYPSLITALNFRLSRHVEVREAGGRVLLRVDVGAAGIVDAVTVVEADSVSEFEEDARQAFASAQFRPALRNGRPVKSRILVHVEYGNPGAASP